jgi:plasmid maintenance system antidote protein VapI
VNPGIPEDQYGVEESDAQAWDVSITQLVERHLASRGWAQSDLARVLGWSPQFLSDVINRRTRIRPRDAIDLGCALGEEPDVLLAIQTKGQLLEALIDLKTSERLRSIAARRRIEEILPSREMIRRGILPDGSPEEIERDGTAPSNRD